MPANKKRARHAKPGKVSLAFWAPLAAVVALLAVVWIANQSDDSPAPSVVATGVANTHGPRADVRLPKPAAHAKAVGNIHPHRDPPPGSGIHTNSDAEQPAIPESEPAPQTADEHPAITATPQQPVATITPTPSAAPPYRSDYTPPPNATGKSTPLPKDAFVVSLAQDDAGRIWIGTEDLGVFRYDPSATGPAQWTEFTTGDGLGDDNAYALCVDRLNRVWVGHLNHGVSVYNGQSWVNYDVPDGPIGERVFSIAADPKSGDVWIATSAGLTRYSLENDTWAHYTRDDGLPSDQIQSLAFDQKGTLYAGTQCDGLAISDPPRTAPVSREALAAGRAAPEPPTRRWRQVVGPDSVPLSPAGPGLPSNLINDVLVSRSGTVFVATTCGLAASSDRGRNWSFIRGADWAAKVKGLYGGPPRGWREGSAPLLLTEDYCTRLAEDDSGLLWIGHRRTGCEAIDPTSLQRRFDSRRGLSPFAESTQQKGTVPLQRPKNADKNGSPDYAMAMLGMPVGPPLVGWYGAGLSPNLPDGKSTAKRAYAAAPISPARHPTPAAAPTLDELNALLARLGNVPTLRQLNPTVVERPDDWRTEGDWLGRYGRYWACCCAMCSPRGYFWGAGPEPILCESQIGPNHSDAGDVLRHWIQWLYTGDRRSLEIPPTYFDSRVIKGLTTPDRNRRQAEWDDHGEAYPMSLDGPDIYCTLTVPAGQFFLSLYDFNKDGHDGANRFRDFRLSVRRHDERELPDYARLYSIDHFSQQPELASGRINQFWGGVWKRYFVQGPIDVTIRIRRNSSFNTLVAAVMLDLVDEMPLPYFCTPDEWRKRMERLSDTRRSLLSEPASARAVRFRQCVSAGAAADQLSGELELMRVRNPQWWASESSPFHAALLRWYRDRLSGPGAGSNGRRLSANVAGPSARVATCYYQLQIFPRWEVLQRAAGFTPARDVEKSLRWDEISPSDQGNGFSIVAKAVAPNGPRE